MALCGVGERCWHVISCYPRGARANGGVAGAPAASGPPHATIMTTKIGTLNIPQEGVAPARGPVSGQSSGRSPASAMRTMRGVKRATTSTRSSCAAITAWMSR